MATYKEIKGVTVQTKDTDPEVNVGSWMVLGASASDMNTASWITTGCAWVYWISYISFMCWW